MNRPSEIVVTDMKLLLENINPWDLDLVREQRHKELRSMGYTLVCEYHHPYAGFSRIYNLTIN